MGRADAKKSFRMKVCQMIVDGGPLRRKIRQFENMKKIKEKMTLGFKYDRIRFVGGKKCQND